MKLTFALALCLFASAALASQLEDFTVFQRTFGRDYRTSLELTRKAKIFAENVRSIRAHNERFMRGEETFSMAVNNFSDMTEKEILAHTGLPKLTEEVMAKWPTTEYSKMKLRASMLNSKTKVPASFDWTTEDGVVSSVKNQGSCGSCSAFATTASIESYFSRKSGSLVSDLSEQYIVDCAYGHSWEGWGASGCDGAWPQAYFDYVRITHQGQNQQESGYQYQARLGSCRPQESNYYTGVPLGSWYNEWNIEDEEMVKFALVNNGPIATTVGVNTAISNYHSGVVNSDACCESVSDSGCTNRNNHAVTIVGYGTEGGVDFWKIKNSWGANWGDHGYFKIKAGTGHCGVVRQMINYPEM